MGNLSENTDQGRFSPRKLPRQERSQFTVEAIFEAAEYILSFEDKAPSSNRIAQKAGVSIGSFYQYFPNKESLFKSLLGVHLKQRVEGMKKAFESVEGLNPEDGARKLVNSMISEKVAHLKVERALMRFFLKSGDVEALTQYDDQMLALVRGYLEKNKPYLRIGDTDQATFLVFNTLRAALLMATLQRPEIVATPEFREEIALLIINYLKK